MILAMMVGYIVILHLIFNVLKIVQPSTRNKIYVTVLGCFLIYCILLFINYYQPMSTDLRVVRFVIPLRTRLQGVVVEVPVQPNVPLKKGDVIFRIDPRPFEVQVARLKAALAEAEQQAKILPVDLAAATSFLLLLLRRTLLWTNAAPTCRATASRCRFWTMASPPSPPLVA